MEMRTNREKFNQLLNTIKEINETSIEKFYHYGNDKVVFDNNLQQLIQHVYKLKEDGQPHSIFLHRNRTGVIFGEQNAEQKEQIHIIQLNNMDGLKRIYDTLQQQFQEQLEIIGLKYAANEGWSMSISLLEPITINIDSNEEYDYDWFQEYAFGEQPKRKTLK